MKHTLFLIAAFLVIILQSLGQSEKGEGHNISLNQKDTSSFPDLIFKDINGAPKLTKPVLIMAETGPVMAEGMGWAAPALWDWDGDGKKDLLIGEFGSGIEIGHLLGSFIRVYKNIGTETFPKFEDNFSYASSRDDVYFPSKSERSTRHLVNYGTPISIPQFCCMSFKPQFADINGDGYPDLYSGIYDPGEVYWFRGFEGGFLQGEKLKQKGDPRAKKVSKLNTNDPNDWSYWFYSAVSFGEFTGDCLLDMIIGRNDGIRISKNIGTKGNPEFDYRTQLLDPEGFPLWDQKWGAHPIPYVVDWDQDGISDLLVTNAYSKDGNVAIMFFKGRQKGTALFEKGLPLFTVKEGTKEFPGEYLNASVGDWNKDGINDLILGVKVAMINGIFDHDLNWKRSGWAVGKLNSGYYSTQKIKAIDEKIKNAVKLEKELGAEEFLRRKNQSGMGIGSDEYLTRDDLIKKYYGGNEAYKALIHKGYVYVMLGKK